MRKILLSTVALATFTNLLVAKESKVESKVPLLKFNGKHYLGFVHNSDKDVSKFETRRNYLQVKAYFDKESKNHFRLTLDTKDVDGNSNVRLKYAYLYLNLKKYLPFTAVEIGQVHKTWIDYESKHGWNYRSISKVFAEKGAGLTKSADRGINFKTNMTNFSSEIGIFNGEGYSSEQSGDGLSYEGRLTYHLLGGGDKKPKASSKYTNISVFGELNTKNEKYAKGDDYKWYGVHAVYNQKEFLLSTQYITTTDAVDKYAGDGYSANGVYRVMKDWSLLARYDSFELEKDGSEKTRLIAGVTHRYSKHVEIIANVIKSEKDLKEDTALMLTAEVNW